MPISLSATNTASTSAFNQTQNRIDDTSRQLASGQQINRASDNPAGIQVLVELQGQILGNGSAISNSINGISALQVAGGGLNQINDSLQQIRELSIQAQNGFLNESDRATLQRQADELLSGINDTLSQTTFNGRSLLTEQGELTLQTGPSQEDTQSVNSFDLNAEFANFGLNNLDITSADALNILDQSRDFVSSVAGEFGAAENRLDSSISRLTESTINETAAASRIGDTDFAQAISERANALLQQEVNISIQAQANASRGLVLNLLA